MRLLVLYTRLAMGINTKIRLDDKYSQLTGRSQKMMTYVT